MSKFYVLVELNPEFIDKLMTDPDYSLQHRLTYYRDFIGHLGDTKVLNMELVSSSHGYNLMVTYDCPHSNIDDVQVDIMLSKARGMITKYQIIRAFEEDDFKRSITKASEKFALHGDE